MNNEAVSQRDQSLLLSLVSQVSVYGPEGVSSSNSQPGAWSLSPLGYSNSDYLSHKGTNHPDYCLSGISSPRECSEVDLLTLFLLVPSHPRGQNMSQRSRPPDTGETTGRRA